ncbi:methyltransferase domain-containing protein [Actinomycetospora endophytica]|uniref:Methyltransferase domain-containing protein n=1 Tax=Actinomycetospora endophytica TaxID=2291215 RepID=A0ABS8PIG3_9PSEU|nr:class I SAM-dependent methyltransferase [Actinomycetospora endophytica]MCD2198060.1 methyltransferase domain-containing protein [Actinomycetospora endophytica]
MTSGSTSDTYARNADFWVKIIREGLDRYRTELTDQAVLDAIGDVSGLDVLDAGCGEGYMSRLLAERGARAAGVDVSGSLIESARTHEAAERLSLKYMVAGLEDLPLEDDSFDIAVCNHVLSDVSNPAAAVQELGRVLRPQGRLVTLMLHPCFYTAHAERDATGSIPVETYFSERSVDQPFVVAGIESPDEVHMNFRPLEFYSSVLADAGFLIERILEPHPAPTVIESSEWWKTNFRKPLFLLISAVKSGKGSGPLARDQA